MFQQLRQGNPFYIINREDGVRAEVGQVTSVTSPQPKFPNTFNPYMPLPAGTEMFVDLKVKVGEKILEFEKLPAVMTMVDFTEQGKPIIVCSSRDAANEKLRLIREDSKQIVESCAYNQKVIDDCDVAISLFNPEIQQADEQQKKIEGLDAKINDINEQFADVNSSIAEIKKMMSMFLINGTKETTSAKTPKNQ